MELDWCLFFRDPRYGLDGRVEIPSNISHLEVKHSNGDDSVRAKIARGHAEQPESSAMRIPAFLYFRIQMIAGLMAFWNVN